MSAFVRCWQPVLMRTLLAWGTQGEDTDSDPIQDKRPSYPRRRRSGKRHTICAVACARQGASRRLCGACGQLFACAKATSPKARRLDPGARGRRPAGTPSLDLPPPSDPSFWTASFQIAFDLTFDRASDRACVRPRGPRPEATAIRVSGLLSLQTAFDRAFELAFVVWLRKSKLRLSRGS